MLVPGLTADGAFLHLILVQIPAIARLPAVQAAMKRYTAGYLTEKRLANTVAHGTMPVVQLAKTDLGAVGNQGGDTICIDPDYFKFFKKGDRAYVIRVPRTVFHELAHWGYRKGQQEGHSSDSFGRAHNNHGDYQSPLDPVLESVFEQHRPLLEPKFVGCDRGMGLNQYMPLPASIGG